MQRQHLLHQGDHVVVAGDVGEVGEIDGQIKRGFLAIFLWMNAMIHEAFVTLCLCGDRCATGYHKDTKAQRKFVSDISMQSNPHNSAKSQKN